MFFKHLVSYMLLAQTISLISATFIASPRWSVEAGTGGESRETGNVAETYPFDESNVATAVDNHNEARRTVEPTAADMLEMSWDEELAELALSYSQECKFEHNPSRTHSQFSQVGENLYISYGSSFSDYFIYAALKQWNSERNDYDYDSLSCTPNKPCGHYTQMVWSSTYKVGCGASKCSSIMVQDNEWQDATLLVCNYGPAGNYRGQQPYTSGVPCDNCLSSHVCSDNLCVSS